MERTVRAHQHETLDALCHRVYGTTALVERALERNPGLAALGPRLPAGTAVVLPDPPDSARETDTIQLWE